MRYKLLLPWVVLIFGGLPMSQAAATEVDAAGYYKLRCATCHGANGEGTRDKSPSLGPPLRGNPLVINAPAEILMSIIRRGRGGQQRVYDDAYPNMPAFDAGLVPDAMGLATYLKTVLQQNELTSQRNNPVPEPVENGDAAGNAARHLQIHHVDRVYLVRDPISSSSAHYAQQRPGVVTADESGSSNSHNLRQIAACELQVQIISPAHKPLLHPTKGVTPCLLL
jgi:mono/diheme cytochrome c family protein